MQEGSNVNKLDDLGHSALYYAASNDYPLVVKELVDIWKASLVCSYNKKNAYTGEVEIFNKETPFHRAAEKGNVKVVRHLVDAGMDINLKISDGCMLFGQTALHRAAGMGQLDSVRLLFESGCNINLQDDDFNTACHLASYRGYLPVVEYLCQQGADLEMINERKETVRDICRRGNANEVDRYLCTLSPTVLLEYAKSRQRDAKKKVADAENDKKKASEKADKLSRYPLKSAKSSLAVSPSSTTGPSAAGGGGAGSGGAADTSATGTDDPISLVSKSEDTESLTTPTEGEDLSANSSNFNRAFRRMRTASLNVGLFSKSEKGGAVGDKGSPMNTSTSMNNLPPMTAAAAAAAAAAGGGGGDVTSTEGDDAASAGTPTSRGSSFDFLKRAGAPLGLSLSSSSKVAVTTFNQPDDERGEAQSSAAAMHRRLVRSLRMLSHEVRQAEAETEADGEGLVGPAGAGGAAGGGAGGVGGGDAWGGGVGRVVPTDAFSLKKGRSRSIRGAMSVHSFEDSATPTTRATPSTSTPLPATPSTSTPLPATPMNADIPMALNHSRSSKEPDLVKSSKLTRSSKSSRSAKN